jgi:hypothetical protein
MKIQAFRMSFLVGLKKQAVTWVAVVLWVPAVAFGINVLWKYSTTPGHPGMPPPDWPSSAPIPRVNGRVTLVMFAHPRCECTKATLGELAIIMAHAPERVDADVFFYLPGRETSAWARTDLWRSASAISGVRVHEDREAAAAQTFGAFTSGQTLLYDTRGRLLFKGGITAFRGHSGDNAGRSAITALLQGETPGQNILPVMTPVLGCSLRGE